MSTDPRQALGRRGETLAAEHFARLGCAILVRNHRTRWGELDLVVADGDVLVFCEVKTARVGARAPWESLHAAKRSQVLRMASVWLSETPDRPYFAELRFDAVGVLLDAEDRLVRLDHVEAAF
jgi:putative endonuclease